MAITNKITITQDQKSVVLMLLEKWNVPARNHAAGHWYLDDGSCGSTVYFFISAPEERFWYYNPAPNGGILGIGARPTAFDYETRETGPQLNTYLALFGVKRMASGRFSVASGGPGTGLLYHEGTTGLNKLKPVTWESEWGAGQYFCPRRWKWD